MNRKSNHQSPLVSVIIVTYNQENFIAECIESCIHQTYLNFEIIIADDCSSDSTSSIIEEYSKKFPGLVKSIRNPTNKGVTENHNSALKHARGELICFLGGDDVLYPTKVEEQVSFFTKFSDCVLHYHNVEVFDSNTSKILYLFNNPKNKARTGSILKLIFFGTFNCACGTMVRRKENLLFDNRIPVSSDWLFWLEVLSKNGGRIYYSKEILSKYRRHSNNVTRDYNLKNELYNRFISLKLFTEKNPQYLIVNVISLSRFLIIGIIVYVKKKFKCAV